MEKKKQRVIVLFALSIFVMAPSAFSWPFGGGKKNNSPEASKKSHVVQQSIAVDSENVSDEKFFDETVPDLPKIDTAALNKIPQLPNVPEHQNTTSLPNLPRIPKVEPQAQRPDLQDAEIARVQNQIHEIIKINENLKTKFTAQAAQIQKISEQAKIHEKILGDLEKTKALASQPNTDNLLNQEKIRLIKKETEANRKYLEGLKTQKDNSIPVNPSSAAADTVKNS